MDITFADFNWRENHHSVTKGCVGSGTSNMEIEHFWQTLLFHYKWKIHEIFHFYNLCLHFWFQALIAAVFLSCILIDQTAWPVLCCLFHWLLLMKFEFPIPNAPLFAAVRNFQTDHFPCTSGLFLQDNEPVEQTWVKVESFLCILQDRTQQNGHLFICKYDFM